MKRKGFVFIPIILIVFCIVTLCSMYIVYLTKLEACMTFSLSDKIQSNYHSETKINRILYDEYYRDTYLEPFIINHLVNPMTAPRSLSIKLKYEDIDDKDTLNKVNVTIYNNDNNRKEISIDTESNYNGIRTSLHKKARVVNDIFEVGKLPIVSYDLCEDLSGKLSLFYNELKDGLILDKIPSKYKIIHTFDHDKISIRSKDSTDNTIKKTRNIAIELEDYNKKTYKDTIFIIENKLYTPLTLEIEESTYKDPLVLNGIIYLEGDLIISGRFKFNGIIILKGKASKIIVNSEIEPVIRGMILTEGNTDYLDKVDIMYNSDYIYKYGIYLPGFFELNTR